MTPTDNDQIAYLLETGQETKARVMIAGLSFSTDPRSRTWQRVWTAYVDRCVAWYDKPRGKVVVASYQQWQGGDGDQHHPEYIMWLLRELRQPCQH